jgi:hypothetical protein
MNAAPDTDIRAALDDASRVAGLTFSPEAVLAEGHRVVRRRRLAATGLVAAATAVVAVVAVQLGTGQPRALPAGDPSSSSTLGQASGELTGSTFDVGVPKNGPGVRVDVSPVGAGRVVERWTLSDGDTVRRTVSRTVPATAPGRASFLMPRESGQQGVVYAYALTGPEGTASGVVMTQVVTAPDLATGQGSGGVLTDPASGRALGSLTRFETGSADPEQVIGLIWNRTRPTTTATPAIDWLADGAALRAGRTVGVDAAVVTVSARTSVLLWRDGDRFGFGRRSGPLALKDAGSLQVGVEPHSPAAAGTENDLAVGWVTAGPVALTSTDPSDAFTVSYGDPVGGRTPFVARSAQPEVKGTVTVTGGGETQTVTSWDSQSS